MEVSVFSFWIVAVLICIILLLILGQLSHFSSMVRSQNRDLEANLIGLAAQLQKMQASLSELLGEERRLLRMQNELLELKRAEMTGDFDIVEEPINAGSAPSPASPAGAGDAAEAPVAGQVSVVDGTVKAPKSFPTL